MTGVRWEDFIKPGDVVVDVGANEGAYAHAFARVVGIHGRVFAFEPNTAKAKQCQKACHGVTCVDVRAMAVGAGTGASPFFTSEDSTLCSRYRVNTEAAWLERPPTAPAVVIAETVVPVTTLDAALDGWPVTGIKVDAQGDDGWVLTGAKRLLAQMPARGWVLAELWPHGLRQAGFDLAELVRMFAGWRLVAHGKCWRETTATLAEVIAPMTTWMGGMHTNVLLMKGFA